MLQGINFSPTHGQVFIDQWLQNTFAALYVDVLNKTRSFLYMKNSLKLPAMYPSNTTWKPFLDMPS